MAAPNRQPAPAHCGQVAWRPREPDTPGAELMWGAFSAIQGYLRYVEFERGEVLVPPGAASEHDQLLLLAEGLVEVNYRVSACSEPELLAVVEPGQLVGEMGLLNGAERVGFCVAATRGCGLALGRDEFQQLLDERPELACHFLLAVMPQVNLHLRDANRRLTCSSQLCRAMQDEINSINFDNKLMADLVMRVKRGDA